MKIFYNVVGFDGAAADFPKTVENPCKLFDLNNFLPEQFVGHPKPSDRYAYFWGVPEGARGKFDTIAPGDILILFESVSSSSSTSYFCEIIGVSKILLPNLSNELWGSDHYPLIFIIKPKKLSMSWSNFKAIIGYEEKYRANLLMNVSEDRLMLFGGIESIVEEIAEYIIIGDLAPSNEKKPILKQKRSKTFAENKVRSSEFRLSVLKAYDYKCAFCGSSLKSKDGKYCLDAAHIYGVEYDGSDDIRNGIALCKEHHWAFDKHLVSINVSYEIVCSPECNAIDSNHSLLALNRREMSLPKKRWMWPHEDFIKARRSALED